MLYMELQFAMKATDACHSGMGSLKLFLIADIQYSKHFSVSVLQTFKMYSVGQRRAIEAFCGTSLEYH